MTRAAMASRSELKRQLEALASALAAESPPDGDVPLRARGARGLFSQRVSYGIASKQLLPVFAVCLFVFALSRVFELFASGSHLWDVQYGWRGGGGGRRQQLGAISVLAGQSWESGTSSSSRDESLAHLLTPTKRQLCVRMPTLDTLRILLVALPPAAFYHGKRVRTDMNATLHLERYDHQEAKARAMWHFAQQKLSADGAELVNFGRKLKLRNIRHALYAPPPRLGEKEERAAAFSSSAMREAHRWYRGAVLPLIRGQARFQFLYESEPAAMLERSLIAAFMAAPYTRIVDGGSITPTMLAATDYVIVPFPMLKMRSQEDVAAKFRSIVAAQVPSLVMAPEKHVFLWARPVQDAVTSSSPSSSSPSSAAAGGSAETREAGESLHALLVREPLATAQLITVEPFRIAGGPQRQHAIPFAAMVRRRLGGSHPRGLEADAPLRRNGSGRAGHAVLSPAEAGTQPWDSMHAGNYFSGASTRSAAAAAVVCDPISMQQQQHPAGAAGRCSSKAMKGAVRRFRRFLAVYVGDTTTAGNKEERAVAMQQLYSSPDCAVFDEPAMRRWMGGDGAGVAWAYRSAVFCVHPPGDRLLTKALYDSLLLGCIPVILDKGDPAARGHAPVLPFSWALPYSEFTLALPMAAWSTRLVESMRAVSGPRLRAMQLRLARAAPLLQYDIPDPGEIFGVVRRMVVRERAGSSANPPPLDSSLAEGGGASSPLKECAADAFDMLLATMHHRRLSALQAKSAGGGARKAAGQAQHSVPHSAANQAPSGAHDVSHGALIH